MVLTILAFDLRHNRFDPSKGVLLLAVVLLVAAAISRFTIRLLARPLALLQSGITSVGEGRLEPIQVSETGDEIQALGESFNKMIAALASAQGEIERHRRLLEMRIEERTEDLKKAMLRSESANRAKSEFLANMSHELRTPMNGILGMLEIALESKLEPDQAEHLETAQRCAYTLLTLLNEILDLSKIEAGKLTFEEIPVKVRALIRDCIHAEQRSANQKGVSIRTDIGPEVPEEIIGDPLRMRQIIGNLVNNAVKFTDKGSVSIQLNSEPAAAGQVRLRLEVRDTGIGIAADKLPVVFEKFTQADSSIGRKYRGTGLGLAITRNLVEMHGGEIRVESQLGHGATFRVTLNVAVPEIETRLEPAPGALDPAVIKPDSSRVRVLVVEDNLVNQKVVSALLQKRNYQVEVARNGQEALDRLENPPDIDLILMDVEMPGLDGLQTARRIRRNPLWKDLPIVALTAHAMSGDRERCLESGMNGYIAKPVQPFQLFSTIETLLGTAAR